MKIRYYVCGLGYDKNLEIIDYEVDFGDFDTYVEAYELFVKLQCRDAESFFVDAPEVYSIDLRVEECEVTDDAIECFNIKNEFGIFNPKFKEEPTIRTDLVINLLDELDLPYDDYCVNYIAQAWEADHEEEIKETYGFEIDEEDVKMYWLGYVNENLFV